MIASLFTNLVELIPKAALAGLLIVIGIQLVKLAHIRVAWRTGNFAIYAITIFCVVFLNLLEGVAIGLAVAILFLLVRVIRAPIEVKPYGGEQAKRWRIDIDGTLSFLLLPRLTSALSSVPPGSEVTLHLNADYLDYAISEAISDWRRAHEATGGVVVIVETSAVKLHHAHTGPPRRHFSPEASGLPPWRSTREEANASVRAGIDEYHRDGISMLHPHMAGLSDGQHPYAMFLTCADSRIMPNLITASGPGDLYIVRNFGNLVPTDGERSVDAALQYAVNELDLSSVVVCGHSSCAAMATLLQENGELATTPMGEWLENARDSLVAYQDRHPARRSAESNGFTEADQLGIVNVAVQVQRLTTHPVLAAAVTSGELQVVGTFFDIASARVYEVDQDGIVCPEQRAGAL